MIGEQGICFLVLNAMLSMSFYLVEQLIVFMLDILNQLLSVVEFDIMRIKVFVMLIMDIEVLWTMFDSMCVGFPVSMSSVVAIGMMRSHRLMDCMVRVEVRLMLNAVDVVMFFMSWMVLMGVRVVVVGTMSMVTDVVVCIMPTVNVALVVWCFMMWSLMVGIMVYNWVM